jgi:hypothetical protein
MNNSMNIVFQRGNSVENTKSSRRNSSNLLSFGNSTFGNSSLSSSSSFSAAPVTQHPAPNASLKPERPQRSRVVIPPTLSFPTSASSTLSSTTNWNEQLQPALSTSQLNFTTVSLQDNVTDESTTDDDDDDDDNDNDNNKSYTNDFENENENRVKYNNVFVKGSTTVSSRLVDTMATSSSSNMMYSTTSSHYSLKSSLALAAEAANAAAASVVGAVASLNQRRGTFVDDNTVKRNVTLSKKGTIRPDEQTSQSAFTLLEQLGSEDFLEKHSHIPTNSVDTIGSLEENSQKNTSILHSSPFSPSNISSSTVSPDTKALVSHLARVVEHQSHLEAELKATQARLAEVERQNLTEASFSSLPSSSSPIKAHESLRFTPRPFLSMNNGNGIVNQNVVNGKSSSAFTNEDNGSLLTITDSSKPHHSSSSTSAATLVSVGGGTLRVSRNIASVALSPTGRTVSSHLQHRLHVTAQHLQRQLSDLQAKSAEASKEAAEREAKLIEYGKQKEEEMKQVIAQLVEKAREEGRKEGAEEVRVSTNLILLEREIETLRLDLNRAKETQVHLQREKDISEAKSEAVTSSLMEEIISAKQEVNIFKEEVERLQTTLVDTSERIKSLEGMLKISNDEKKNICAQTSDQERLVEELRSILTEGNKEFELVSTECDRLRKELDTSNEIITTLRESVSEAESKKNEYEVKLNQCRLDLQNKETSIEDIRLELIEKSEENLKALRRDDQETISELMGVIAALKTRRIETERLLSLSKERELFESTRASTAENLLSKERMKSESQQIELQNAMELHLNFKSRESMHAEQFAQIDKLRDLEYQKKIQDNDKLVKEIESLRIEIESLRSFNVPASNLEYKSVASQTSPLPSPGILSPRKLEEFMSLESEISTGKFERIALSAQLETARDLHESALREIEMTNVKFNEERHLLQQQLDSLKTNVKSNTLNPAITAAAVASATSSLRMKLLQKDAALLQAVSAAEQAALAAEQAEKMEREVSSIIPLLRSAYEQRLRFHGLPIPTDSEINLILSNGSHLSNDSVEVDGSPRSTMSAPNTDLSSTFSKRQQRFDQGDLSFRQLLGSTFGSLSQSIVSSSFPSPLNSSPSILSLANISSNVLMSAENVQRQSLSDQKSSSVNPGFISPATPMLNLESRLPTPTEEVKKPSIITTSENGRSLIFSPNSQIETISALEALAALPINDFSSSQIKLPKGITKDIEGNSEIVSLESILLNAMSEGLNADETAVLLQNALGLTTSTVSDIKTPFLARGKAATSLGLRKDGVSQLRSPE